MIHSFIYEPGQPCEKDPPPDRIGAALGDPAKCIWVDFDNPPSEEQELLTTLFNFHPLAIEDCLNVKHHPKIDDYESCLFLILHAPASRKEEEELKTSELDIFFGKNFVVTYHIQPIVSVQQTLERVEKSPETVMGRGTDFFLHSLIDRMMERYLPMVEDLAEQISWAEQEVFYNPDEKFLSAIFNLKKDIIYIRRIMLPQRDTTLQLSKGDYPLISEKARVYFRDTYDLLYRITDLIDAYRDLVNSTIEAYMIMDANRVNRIMKGLSVMAAVFLPLTVITGIYGMNFRFMPELDWRLGYPFALVMMVVVVASLLFYMKKRDWL